MDPGSKTPVQLQLGPTYSYDFQQHLRTRQFPILVDAYGNIDWHGVDEYTNTMTKFTNTCPGFPINQLPQNKKTAKPAHTACRHVGPSPRPLSALDVPLFPRRTPIKQTNLLIAGMKFNSNPASRIDKHQDTTIKD